MPTEWTQDPPERGRAYRYWWPTVKAAPGTPGQFLWQQNEPFGMRNPFAGDWGAAVSSGMVRSVESDAPLRDGWPSNYYFRFPEHAKLGFPVGEPLPAAVLDTICHLTGEAHRSRGE
jgi:hypothetical protein